ncbi:hypothetical protein BBO99_00009521, partial [Phytophthora kernoviae]
MSTAATAATAEERDDAVRQAQGVAGLKSRLKVLTDIAEEKVYTFPDELAQEQARSAMLTTQLTTATLIQGSATTLQSELGQERVRTTDLSAQLTTATFSHAVASS